MKIISFFKPQICSEYISYKNMTYKNMRLRMSKNKNIFKNIDHAENLGEIRNKKLLSLIDLFS